MKGKSSGKFRIPLRLQFTFFVVMVIGAIMALTTLLTYRQQQKSLRDEVVQRGATIARSLASSAAEAVLNDLVCAALIHETMPDSKLNHPPEITLETVLASLLEDLGRDRGRYDLKPNAGVVEVLMTDTNGTIVAHNDIQMVSKIYQSPAGVKPYAGEATLVQPYVNPDGRKRVDIAVPILVNRLGNVEGRRIGVVHLRMSQDWVDWIVEQAAFKLLVVTGVVLLLGIMIASWLARFMTHPIKKVVGGVLAIASGNLNQKLESHRKDELGELTNAFNQMAASLREKELIKGAFSTYVSSQVMDEVLKTPGKLALGGARKRATIFFSDIRGFTSMSETMQPEEVVSIINVYLSLQTEIILRNRGMLDKFIGDCVMAVYGIPLPGTDDALRAVRSAVQIQAAVQAINQKRKQSGERTVTLGIGINTGEVVSGNMGSSQKMDYTVIGDSVNLAARLESAAEGGSVLVSEETYQLVKEHVVAEKLSPIPVKGKKEKVPVYSIVSMKA